jgi:hypothetical protein
MSTVQSDDTRNPIVRFLTSEVALGTLIAILSILTAVASYQSGLAGAAEGDANIEGQRLLADSNAEYVLVNQEVVYDYNMFDGYYINDGEDQFRADYYRDEFSEALNAGMERDEEDPFDDAYYDEVFADADDLYDEATAKFEDAQVASEKANKLQLVMLIMAVGLSFAAWASLLDGASKMRLFFAIAALAALILGLLNYIPAL